MRSLLLLAVTALVAGGAFFLLQGDGPNPSAPASANAGGDPGAGPQGPSTGPADLASVESLDGDRAAAEVGEGVARVAPALEESAAGPATRPERAPGAVVGRVTDRDGQPLAGADVQLMGGARMLLLDTRAGGNGGADPVTTDEQGRFRIEARPGRHDLTVGSDRYAPFEQSVDLASGRDTDVGEIQLAPGVRIVGRVLDDRGRPVKGATITRPVKRSGGFIRLGALGALAAETDAEGRFEILRQAVGPYEFSVDHPSYPRGRFDGETEREGELVSGIEVTLRVGAQISGQVTGALEDDLVVAARPARGGDGAIAFDIGGSLDSFGSAVRRGDLQPDGTFTVQGLAEGAAYQVWLERPRRRFDGSARRSERVRATAGDSGVALTYSPGASVRVTLKGPDGEPVAGAEITGGYEWLAPLGELETDDTTGTYTGLHLWPSKNESAYRLRVSAVGYETWESEGIELVAGEITDLGVVELAGKPQLLVTVTDAATGRPVEGAKVSVEKVREASPGGAMRFSATISTDEEVDIDDVAFGGGVANDTTDEDGQCSVDVTPGDRVWVDVTHPGFAEQRHGPLTLAADESSFEASVGLGPGGSVRVSVIDHTGAPMPGARVETRGDDGRPARGAETTDDSGEALFQGLAAGAYGFRIAEDRPSGGIILVTQALGGGDTEGWTDVTVLPGDVVPLTLQAEEPCDLTGRITEAGVPLAGATVRLRAAAGSDPLAGLGFGLGGGASATTDARGRYRLDGVDAGDMTLVVEHPTRAMDHEEPIAIERGDNERDVDLTITTIAGKVIGPDGEPVVGARVEAKRQAEGPQRRAMVSFVVSTSDDEGEAAFIGGEPGGPEPVFTDEDGRYVLRGVQPDVKLVVEASAKDLDKTRSDEFTLDAGDQREDVDLTFVQTGSLTINVEGADGPLIAVLTRRGESTRDPRVEQIQGSSKTIEGLEAGRWEVRLNAIQTGGDVPPRISPERETVDIVSGETATLSFSVE